MHFATGTGLMTTMSNSMVIENADHLMLVDTSVTPAAARALVAQIKEELSPKPIKYVFNSHYHFDHAHGNQIFGDDVEIIGHEYIRNDAPVQCHPAAHQPCLHRSAAEPDRAA